MSTSVISRRPSRTLPRSTFERGLAPPRRQSRCFEVLIPYHDEAQALSMDLSLDARFSMVLTIWARDAEEACAFARERFREHRVRSPRAKIASGGPVALRVVPPVKS